jgi:integrase
VRLHIKPELGNIKLSALTTPRVETFRDDLVASMSRAMAKKVLGSLKAILKDAKRRGNVAQNVAADTKAGTDKRSKRKLKAGEDFPLPAEVKQMVDASDGRGRAVLIVSAFVGLRASELRGLHWPGVELTGAEPKIHIRQRADRYGNMGNPKSEAGEREVPIGPMVVNTLKELRKKSTGNLVFGNGAGNPENHSNLVQRVLHRVQLKAGVTVPVLDKNGKPVLDKDGKPQVAPKYTGMHSLRHFYASWCINRRQNGGLELPLKEVQHRLGHATLAMTADTYGHLFPRVDHTAEIAEAERKLFGLVA